MSESNGRRIGREFRTEELAREAGIPVRTLRFYREKRLLPPPRRDGRVVWYSEDHLARLRIIARLLERGHTLGGIAELLAAWEQGRDVAELLGLEGAIAAPWSAESPVPVTRAELRAAYPGQVDDDAVAAAQKLGYLRGEGEELTHVSRRLLDASAQLVASGVPLRDVLDTAVGVRASAEALAGQFVELISRHLFRDLASLTPAETARLTETVQRLREVARTVVDVEFGLAMDRRVQAELSEVLTHLAVRSGAP
ncbi:MerR family transcriptional regulator [Streptacidiphilus monticola]|uniref:MerR family transcriptional regulator n=1 Tax=Streptacidiphilus monticola TaxID=2161674 RepID=A0ABW1G6V5_9ACTN